MITDTAVGRDILRKVIQRVMLMTMVVVIMMVVTVMMVMTRYF